MCGVFFYYSKFPKKNKKNFKKNFLKYLGKRGPDGLKEIKRKNSYAIHSRLGITGNQAQPLDNKSFLLLYNGEIYNDWKKYNKTYGDAQYLNNFIKKTGYSNFKKLDGEYAIIIHDKIKNNLHLISDVFGTKPLAYAIYNNQVYVSSYDQTLLDLKINKKYIKNITPNTHIKIKLDTLKIKKNFEYKKFNFNHKKNINYSHFYKAFENSILKRSMNLQKKICVPLSSGIDSGAIAAFMNYKNIKFTSYVVNYDEDADILKKRKKILIQNSQKIKNLLINNNIKKKERSFLKKNAPFFSINIDYKPYLSDDYRDIPGFIATSKICRTARKEKNLILMSGQGADEIISDYFNEFTNSRRSCFKGNWKLAKKPWYNFYNGWNRVYLAASERVAGSHGIESRYPFLDYDLIQTFLELSPKLKGKIYKAPIVNILDKIKFPYHLKKIGFTGYKSKRKKYK